MFEEGLKDMINYFAKKELIDYCNYKGIEINKEYTLKELGL